MRILVFVFCVFLITGIRAAENSGEVLYHQHCSACHGISGKGGTGVPLANRDFQSQVSDHYLFNTIRNGRPGRVMPAYPMLGDSEINQIVKHIRGFSKAESPKHDSMLVRGNNKNGKRLFQKHCASCHGKNAEGGQGTGVTFSRSRDLPILAPALNNRGFLTSATDSMIKRTLMQGRQGTPMESYIKKGLNEKDINDIVGYIRSFEEHLRQQIKSEEDIPLTIEFESPYNLETVIENIKRAAQGKNFRLIRTQYMDNGLVDKGAENKSEVIIYFCNFKLLNQALKIDSRVGLFLPCRVTAFEQNGKVKVIAINPKRLSYLFNNNELNLLCDQMYNTYIEILEEATL